MNPKIKQKIEEEALRRFPFIKVEHLDTGYPYDTNHERRAGFVQGAEYGYNIKESVNHQMLDALKRINDCSLSKQQREIMIENAILSASNQENNEGEKCEHKHIMYINEDLGYLCTECRKFNIKRN